MSGKYLFDTNIVIALFAGDSDVTDHLRDADEVLIPAIVIGELFYGANRSGRREENLARVEQFAVESRVLGCDGETARWYGRIKSFLAESGRPIPENDIWIAAIARQHELLLVTRDTHFNEIDDLQRVSW